MNHSFEWLQEHRSVITKNRQGVCMSVLNMQQNFALFIDVNVW